MAFDPDRIPITEDEIGEAFLWACADVGIDPAKITPDQALAGLEYLDDFYLCNEATPRQAIEGEMFGAWFYDAVLYTDEEGFDIRDAYELLLGGRTRLPARIRPEMRALAAARVERRRRCRCRCFGLECGCR